MAPSQDPTVHLDDLMESERDIVAHLRANGLDIDLDALALVSNVHRAAAVLRRHLEAQVLSPQRLSWTAFTTLWVLWIWGEMETRHLAAETNVSKGTLTGVVSTLETRGLVVRRRRTSDRRLVTVQLTGAGRELITEVFPQFNREEQRIAGLLSGRQRRAMTDGLRTMVREVPELGDHAD